MTFAIQRGVNIGGWLSRSKRRVPERRAFFARADADKLAARGFAQVRLPADEERMRT